MEKKLCIFKLADFISKKTGENYLLHIGEELLFENNPSKCYMLAPASLGKLKCRAGYDDDEKFFFNAFDEQGNDVFNNKKFVFLWSTDVLLDTDQSQIYITKEGIQNGVLCLNMLSHLEMEELIQSI